MEEKDDLIADFVDRKRRADQLRSIKEFKFEQLMKAIYLHYPDIAGSASSSDKVFQGLFLLYGIHYHFF